MRKTVQLYGNRQSNYFLLSSTLQLFKWTETSPLKTAIVSLVISKLPDPLIALYFRTLFIHMLRNQHNNVTAPLNFQLVNFTHSNQWLFHFFSLPGRVGKTSQRTWYLSWTLREIGYTCRSMFYREGYNKQIQEVVISLGSTIYKVYNHISLEMNSINKKVIFCRLLLM